MASIPAFLRGRKGGGKFTNTPDTIRSEDTVEVILAVGEGENFGLAEGAKSMLLGGTRLVNTNGEANFTNFQLTEYTGQENPPPIYPALGGFGSPSSAGVSSLAKHVSVVRTGQLTRIDYLDLRFLIQQLHWSNDKGIYPHQLDIKVEYRPSLPAGEPWKLAWSYVPPATPGYDESITPGVNTYTNNQTVQDYWGNVVTFEGDDIYLRNDQAADGPIGDFTNIWVTPGSGAGAGMPNVWDEGSQSWKPAPGVVDNGTHWTYGTVNFYKNPPTPPPNPSVGDVWTPPDGKPPVRFNGTSWISAILSSQAAFAYNNQPTMGNANGVLSMRQKLTSATVREVRVPVEPIDVPYEIRVTKISDDTSSDGKYVSEVGWESFEEIVARAMSFPNTHVIHFVGRASDQFNSLPELQGDIKGRIVSVPSNYDPLTRTYSGVWDSTFKKAWTDNGAWCTRDFIKNNRYGLSALYPHEVNEANFYNWAQWCDQAVPNNKGSSRPRWTYNDVLDQPRPAKEQANYMAGSCGAKLLDDGSGVWDVLVDRDEPISMIFGPENVVDGEFTYSFTSIQSRANWIKVGFVNPELNWEIDYRLVKDDDHIAEYGRIPFEYVATGKTNVSEALASARLRLATSTGEYTAVTYRTNRVGKYLYPFKVVGLCDPDMGWGVSGRISEQTGPRQIRLRDAVYLEAGIHYKFVFNRPTVPMTTVSMSVTPGQTGSLKTINFTADLPDDLPEFAQFALESYNNAGEPIALPKAFKILTITPSDDSEIVEITAMEVNRSKWPFSDGTGELLPPEEFSDFTGGVPKPRNVKVKPVISTIGGLTRRSLYVSWDQPTNPFVRNTIIEYSRDGNDFVEIARSSSEFYEIQDITAGIHSLRLMHVHVDGVRKSLPVTIVHEVGSDYRDVPYPINVRLIDELDAPNFDSLSPLFRWDHGAEDPNFKHYRVKIYHLDEDGETELALVYTEDTGGLAEFLYPFEKIIEHGRKRSFSVRVHKVDDFGGESPPSEKYIVTNPLPAAPSSIAITPAMDGFNVRWAQNTDRDFGGVRLYMARTADELEADYTAAELVYTGNDAQALVIVPEDGDYYFVLASYDLYKPDEQRPSSIFTSSAIVGGIDWDRIDGVITDKVTEGTAALNQQLANLTDLVNQTNEALQEEVDGLETQIGTLTLQVADLPNEYASLTQFGLIKSEIEDARDGSATLSAQLATMRQTVVDGLAGKATTTDMTNLTGRVTTAEGDITAQNGRLSQVETDITGKASASELDTLKAEVTGARNGSVDLASQLSTMRQTVVDGLAGKASSTEFTSFKSEIIDARNGSTSLSSQLSAMRQTVVDGLAGKASAFDLSQLSATVGGHTSSITTLQQADATIDGKVNNIVSLKQEAGGIISGYQSINNGVTSAFKIQSDIFELVPSTGTGRRLHWSNGNIVMYDDANNDRIWLGVNL